MEREESGCRWSREEGGCRWRGKRVGVGGVGNE